MRAQIIQKIRTILSLLRDVFSDNAFITKTISKEYENVLIDEFKLVPEQFDEKILMGISYGEALAKSIDFKKMQISINDLSKKYPLTSHINSFNLAKSAIEHTINDVKDQHRIINLLIKFRPIFSCIDLIIINPNEYVEKIKYITDDSASLL